MAALSAADIFFSGRDVLEDWSGTVFLDGIAAMSLRYAKQHRVLVPEDTDAGYVDSFVPLFVDFPDGWFRGDGIWGIPDGGGGCVGGSGNLFHGGGRKSNGGRRKAAGERAGCAAASNAGRRCRWAGKGAAGAKAD